MELCGLQSRYQQGLRLPFQALFAFPPARGQQHALAVALPDFKASSTASSNCPRSDPLLPPPSVETCESLGPWIIQDPLLSSRPAD